MGNAVSPCVASALGRCLALAAAGAVPADLDHAVVPVPDPQLIKVYPPQIITHSLPTIQVALPRAACHPPYTKE